MSDRLISIDTTKAAGSQFPVPVQTEIKVLADAVTPSGGSGSYTKPSGGIPESDLASALQAKIDGSATTLAAVTTVGGQLMTASTPAVARTALGPLVFDARDYGVIADGTAHNNVANLLDCFAACAASISPLSANKGTITKLSGRYQHTVLHSNLHDKS